MKKTVSLLMAIVMIMTFAACGKNENKADISVKEGEVMLTGKVEKVTGNMLLLKCEDCPYGDRFYVSYSDSVEVAVDGWYVVDLSADSFDGKEISVICSEMIAETYPAQTRDVRMIIAEKI